MGVENPFVHLHVHSQYSLLEATCRLDKLVKKAAEDKMPAVALTDNGNMFGAAEFYFAAKDAGVKPIIGIDAYLAPKSRLVKGEDKEAAQIPNRRIVLLAQDLDGYRNLCALASLGFQEGFYYKPRIDFDLLRKYHSGLIALSGGSRGEVGYAFERFGPDQALEKVRELKEIFGDRFYLELNRTGTPEWEKLNPFLIEASRIASVPLVATNNVHYLEKEDQLAQEVLICIGSNKTLQDESRYRLGSDQFYFRSSAQMRTLFKDQPQAFDATLEIAERCDVKFKLKDDRGKTIYHLPTFPTHDGLSQAEDIRVRSQEGLKQRIQEALERQEPIAEDLRPKYLDRLEYELGVIEKMGFTSYFLIVQDFINWAKNNGVPVGPGRGSGAGSLVAYCLRITDLDPVRYNLLFERFLNPERISMPDFDIDFCQEKRGSVIDYVTQKYGTTNVSQIITYGKLQARAALRDVGRVLGMTFAEVDVISKLMPDKLGVTLTEALEIEPRLKEQIELNPQIATLFDLARRIEGLVRNAGIHAAGVIISDKPLVEHVPMYRGSDGETVVQYDMKYAEKMGLIKFDFLGLKTLTLIQNCVELIEKNRGKKVVPSAIPVSDKGIYEIMCQGDTLGIFQFESEGITDTVKKIRPTCFEDITAINALYRPGPMDMIPEFTANMHKEKKIVYLFPELEEILSETYGVIIYQEQVMAIASRIAKYSLGEADLLRRAMGKKIASEMDAQKERFLKGAKENGFDEKKSGQLFELMKEFANYGFNKSHAAAYCVVAAQTAWLKRYYPIEFYAALLSTEMGNTDNVVKYIRDVRAREIAVKPPHISHSDFRFSVKGEEIYFSLGAIKGVGEGAVQAIIEAREKTPHGRFETLEQFFEVVDTRRVNKKTIECLIKAGAFDGFGPHRAQLMENYTQYLDRAEQTRVDREVGQGSLFAMLDFQPSDSMSADNSSGHSERSSVGSSAGSSAGMSSVTLTETAPWSRMAKLTYEKDVLGFYLSDHPMSGLGTLYKAWISCEINGLAKKEPKKRVVVAGLISSFSEKLTKRGTRMAFAQLEDTTGAVELVVFSDTYSKHEFALKSEAPVLVGGNLEVEEGTCKILVDRVMPLDEAVRKSKQMIVRLDQTMTTHLEKLNGLMKRFPGSTGVELEIEIPELKQTVTMDVTDPEGINPSQEFFEDVQILFGRTDFIEIRV